MNQSMKKNQPKSTEKKDIGAKIAAYKKLFFFNQLVKGSLFFGTILLSIFLTFNLIEHFAQLSSEGRATLFFIFLGITLASGIHFLIIPLLYFLNINKNLSDEHAALQIGEEFPDIKDKLLNLIQLNKNKDVLAQAAVMQKTIEFEKHEFTEAVKIEKNRKYFPYILTPSIIIILSIIFWPNLIYKSTERIINYDQQFKPEMPFKVKILNSKLEAIHNEDFKLRIAVEGKNIPAHIYLLNNGRKIKMSKTEGKDSSFEYEFKKIQKEHSVIINAANHIIGPYKISMIHRAILNKISLKIKYPAYTKKKTETIHNMGNIEVPKGSLISWHLETDHCDKLQVNFPEIDKELKPRKVKDNEFLFSIKPLKSTTYTIYLQNEEDLSPNSIHYQIKVTNDSYPKITAEILPDSTLYRYLIIGGQISDDYGVSKLVLRYKKNKDRKFKSKIIPISKNKTKQSYYYNWQLESTELRYGDKLEYYLTVFDNDKVNGYKSTSTNHFVFKMPEKDKIKDNIQQSNVETEKKLTESLNQAKDLKENLQRVEDRLKTKKELDWQDKKILESLIEQRKEVEKEIDKLNKQFKEELKVREHFDENKDDAKDKEIAQKTKQLQKLMNEVLDEETKKLYQELQKMLQEKTMDYNKVQEQLDKLNDKESNLDSELERALELFKQMKVELKLEELVEYMEKLSQSQEQLSKEDINKSNFSKIAEKQDSINKEFGKLEKNLDQLQSLNQELEQPNAIPETKSEIKDIKKEQNDFKNAYKAKARKLAEKKQDDIKDKMNSLAGKLKQMKDNMESEQVSENLETLRKIQSNLIEASFEQETILEKFKEIKQNNPDFVQYSKRQLNLKNNIEIVKDSLNALSKRVFQLSATITRELNDMNMHMQDAITGIKDRKIHKTKVHQQFTMTTMNNLALMLDRLISKMQDQKQQNGKGKGKKKKKSKPSSSMSELQKQLNKKIQDLKKSGKSGRQLSEEVAKLAGEQERIRRSLEEYNKKSSRIGGNKEKQEIQKLVKEMEKTELDLVNKRLTQETILRQEQINSQLLKTEKALKEQEIDKKRKAEQNKEDYDKALPKAFEKYIEMKKKELEQYKTIPVELNPYFKEEVNKYFNQKQN